MVVDLRAVPGSANYYFYQHATGQVVFCLTPDPPLRGTDRHETSSFLLQIAPRLISVLPMLKHLKVRRTWRGLYPMTTDGMPIVGPVNGLGGYLNAVGMCGQGFMLGPGLAVYLRRLITGNVDEETQTVLSQLALDRTSSAAEALK
jgi:sarcosine oxidase subunit beta